MDKVVLGLEYADPRVEDGVVANFDDLLNDLGSCRGPGHQDLKSGNRGIVEPVTLQYDGTYPNIQKWSRPLPNIGARMEVLALPTEDSTHGSDFTM